jgi:hypothetical protein
LKTPTQGSPNPAIFYLEQKGNMTLPNWSTREHLIFALSYCLKHFKPSRLKEISSGEARYAAERIADHLRTSGFEIRMTEPVQAMPGMGWRCCGAEPVLQGQRCPLCGKEDLALGPMSSRQREHVGPNRAALPCRPFLPGPLGPV